MTSATTPARSPRALPNVDSLTIGILGGTGDQGRGLAFRLAIAGQKVIIGSRRAERAARAAAEIGHDVRGLENLQCAAQADLVIVAVPWEGHGALLESLVEPLAGKIVVDCVNPIGFDKRGAYALTVEDGSAAEQAERLLPDSTVTAAFHHVSAVLLADPAVETVEGDVLVLGDHREATDTVQALANRIKDMRGIYGGRLRNAHQVEALTANIISINRRYKAHASIRITDV
jgi:NADPH-dependent F420 reductase